MQRVMVAKKFPYTGRPYTGRMLLAVALLLLFAVPAFARTDLQLPRYASLKSNDVNVRTGPGLRYQIKWVLVRAGLPVEVIAEFEQWRKIKDIEGGEGWVHSAMLSGQRTTIVTGTDAQTMYESQDRGSEPIAHLEPAAQADLLECTKEFCKIRAGDYKGWVERAHLWGIYPEEWMQ